VARRPAHRAQQTGAQVALAAVGPPWSPRALGTGRRLAEARAPARAGETAVSRRGERAANSACAAQQAQNRRQKHVCFCLI